MTKEQILKIYGNIYVSFSEYYKYCFYFHGKLKDLSVCAIAGFDSGDIYKMNIDTLLHKLKDHPEIELFHFIEIKKGDEIVARYESDIY